LTLLDLLTALAAPSWAQSPPAADESPVVEAPSILQYVEAAYPEGALAAGLEATVQLRITLSADAVVENVEVVGPQGNGFDEAAVDAVRRMTWSPARTAEGPVPVVFDFDYGFVLKPANGVEPLPGEVPVNLQGQILEMATRNPVVGASVQVVGTDRVELTDDGGRFAFRGLPVGTVTLQLSQPDFVSGERQLEITEGEVADVKLWMRASAYKDNEIVVTARREKEEVTRRTISIEEIRRIPGTFGDPVRVIQTLPGAARAPFGSGLLVIRGADPEDSGVYIDGIRVPIIYHLTGATSVLSPELISGVDYLPGGYGAQFGRTMGGTVNVKTTTEFGDDDVLTWGTDILDSQVFYRAKLGKNRQHGLAVAARRSYVDLFIPLLTGESGFVLKPVYWDYQVKWIPTLPNGDQFSVFVYGFDDLLRASTPDDVAQGTDQDTQGDLEVGYSSHRVVSRYAHLFSDRLRSEVIASFGLDGTNSSLGSEFGLRSSQWVPQVRANLSYKPIPQVEIEPGIDALGGVYRFEFLSAIDFASFDDPLAERQGVSFDGVGSFWSPDPYLRVDVKPLEQGSDRWLMSLGLRGSTLILDAGGEIAGDQPPPVGVKGAIDPRFLTRFQVVPDRFAVKAATGLYHQPPQPSEALGLGGQSTTGFERAWSTSIGWEQRLTYAIQYDVDVFYRQMSDLIVFDESFSGFGTNPFVNLGDGRAYGIEVMARHDPVGRLFGWVSYTLSRAARRDPYCDDPSGEDALLGTGGCWSLFDFDQTHIFSAQAGYDLPYDIGVSAQVQLVTGNPTSELNTGIFDADSNVYNGLQVGGFNTQRLPPFFQTSLRVDRQWTFRKWQLTTYVDLLNAVRGVNPEFTVYNYDYTQSAYVRGLPFIPNIGIEAKFFP
jgi:TonB family protein